MNQFQMKIFFNVLFVCTYNDGGTGNAKENLC